MTGSTLGAVTPRDGGMPISATAIRMGGDGRLTTYRTESGKLMCRAQAGLLCSEVPVMASVCGDEMGCNGRWLCLTRSIEKLMITSDFEPDFTPKV